MIISSVELLNFRNHLKKNFSFAPEITIIIGKNASGKTNLLEALYFLSAGRSFRMGKELQIINFDKEIARIKGKVNSNGDEKTLEIVLTKGEVMGVTTPTKKFLINDVAKRNIDFTGTLKSVLFWPEDMELVTGSPSLRRKHMDFILFQVDREYRRTHASYERGIRQRNKLLYEIRENQAHAHQIIFWDQLLIKQGNYITKKREEFINYINDFKLKKLTESQTDYQVFYDSSFISRERLDHYKDAEIASGVTLVGPHRDDIILRIKSPQMRKISEAGNGEYLDLATYGSRGEQRLAVLWMKLAELSYIKENTGENPVLILDDIFSELDHEHREFIIDMVGKQQSILSVTDRHLIPSIYYKSAQVIELGNGK